MEKVTFGTNVSTIGRNAFDNCPSLKELYLPEGVTVIGLNAFTSCTKLKKLLLPNSEKLRFFMEHEGLEKYVDDPSIIEWY